MARTVGAVTYTLHRQCNFAADRGCAFGPKGERCEDQNTINNASIEPTDAPLRLPGLEIGPLYDCDESDDAECDLCGRAGGILQFFDVDPQRSSLPPPGEEGWLAHVPCKCYPPNPNIVYPYTVIFDMETIYPRHNQLLRYLMYLTL